MLEDCRENSSFASGPCSISARLRRACTYRSSISCSWSQDFGGTDIFCQRTSPVVFGPRVQSSRKTIDTSREDFNFGRVVDAGGLLARSKVGAGVALFGALR